MKYPDILPSSSSKLSRALEKTAQRISYEVLGRYSKIGDDLSRVFNLDAYLLDPKLEEFLPFLAYTLSIPVWRDEWSVRQKVDFIRVWQVCKANAGTKKSIEDAIKSLSFNAKIVSDGPFSFKCRIDEILTPEDRRSIRNIIEELKPLRCSSKLEIVSSLYAEMGLLGTTSICKVLRINSMAIFRQIITKVGLSSIFSEGGERGVSYEFTKIKFGKGKYEPSEAQTDLKDIIGEISVSDTKNFERSDNSGKSLYGTNITGTIGEESEFDIYEIGLWVRANGKEVLLGVVASPDKPISRKISGEELLISIDLFTTKELTNVAIVGTGERLNLSVDDQISDISKDNIDIRRLLQELDRKISEQANTISILNSKIKILEGKA